MHKLMLLARIGHCLITQVDVNALRPTEAAPRRAQHAPRGRGVKGYARSCR